MTSHLQKKIDTVALRKLYQENPAARAVLEHLAGRKNSFWNTSVDRITWNIQGDNRTVSRGDVVWVFQQLAKLGCGKFILGRRGQASRLQWSVHMVSVGRAAIGEVSEVEELTGDERKEETNNDMQSHLYRLRPDLTVGFELPINLTTHEAERIASFIKTLPFPELPPEE